MPKLVRLVLFLSVTATTLSAAQVPEASFDQIFEGELLFDDLQQILLEADQPLTIEQIAALEPMLELGTGESFQRGAIIDPELRQRADDILTANQRIALQRSEAGRKLLEGGLEGLREELERSDVPALTFDQETQIRSVYDAHMRALDDVVEGSSGNPDAIEPEVRELQDQLLLASLKFLNPVQRTAFAGSVSAVDFASLNSDLPEDPTELQEYLDDLRSPAGGGGGNNNNFGGGGNRGGGNRGGGNRGGGGRMPNRDEIQEIRINENSFTSEQSNQGRGQTQIITRGGAGSFNGDLTFQFADESLDARNAFANSRPPYQRRNFNWNVSGPVIRDRLTVTFGMMNNNSEQGDNLQAFTPNGLISDAIARPQEQRGYTINSTSQLNENNVLSARVSTFARSDLLNGVGQEGLPEQGSTNDQGSFNLNFSETAVLSRSFSNEASFGLQRGHWNNLPINEGVHINVQSTFRGGGSPNDSSNDQYRYEFSDLLMYTGNVWNIRTGFQGSSQRSESESRANFNGTYTFSSLYDYCGEVNPAFTLPGCVTAQQEALAEDPGATPQPASTLTIKQGDPFLDVSQFQAATFLQSDWRVRPELTLSFGARYEWQTNLSDSNNLDPRFGFAYALGADTVLRGGTGTFHQRLWEGYTTNLLRFDGTRQLNIEISNPVFDLFDPLGANGGGTTDPPSSIRVHADSLAAPYTWHSEISIETEFDNGMVLTGSYSFVRGIRQFREHNTNAPLPACIALMPGGLTTDEQTEFARLCRPLPDEGNIKQVNSTGSSSDNRLRFGFRQRLSFININGSYEFNTNYDDVSNPANNYDLDAEWARSGARHGFDTRVNVRLPFNINADTSFDWSSGSPYTLQTGTDDNFDTSNNDRPAGVPRNSLTGPGFFEVGMRFSKSIQLRSNEVAVGEGGPIASGGYYGGRTGLRMTIQADIRNLLNKVNFQNPNGVQSSSFFGQFTRARDARSVQMQVRFDF